MMTQQKWQWTDDQPVAPSAECMIRVSYQPSLPTGHAGGSGKCSSARTARSANGQGSPWIRYDELTGSREREVLSLVDNHLIRVNILHA